MKIQLNKLDNDNSFKRKILYTFMAVLLIITVFFAMLSAVYFEAENIGYENLHLQTAEIKEDIRFQVESEVENLQTMAHFAAKLHEDGEDYEMLVNSFKSVGLMENIGILLPDDTFLTKAGKSSAKGKMSFAEEIKKGEYISGVVNDITVEDREIIRCAMPVVSNGETVAVIYGVIRIEKLEERYIERASSKSAQLYILEGKNGNFIINIHGNKIRNISTLETREYKKDFSYELLKDDILSGNNGYTSFVSKITGDVLYAHYAPIGVSDWQIMLAMPEKVVFKDANIISHKMISTGMLSVLIMCIYIILFVVIERKQHKISLFAANVRKSLIEINHYNDSIFEALENIAYFAQGRSSFYIDTDGVEYNYIKPSMASQLLVGEDRQFFVSGILNSAANIKKTSGVDLEILQIVSDDKLSETAPKFCEFLRNHGIENIVFASAINEKNHISILGVINPKKEKEIKVLLKEIAVCFAMAISNKKHLGKTEQSAITDSLTGLLNRVAYKRIVEQFNESVSGVLACVYIDVNELHFVNNKYGHAAGDEMLIYIATSLKELFPDGYVYRMGGDEFLVFCEDSVVEDVNRRLDLLNEKVEARNYHISIGTDFCTQTKDTEALVKIAEQRMYEAKALYYQRKEENNHNKATENTEGNYTYIKTGNAQIDTMLSVITEYYTAIYAVSLKSDVRQHILTPEYLKRISQSEASFTAGFTRYVHENVNADYHRAMLSFFNYDVIRKQLAEGKTPSIRYQKTNGDKKVLTVYAVPGQDEIDNTLWVFEKEI